MKNKFVIFLMTALIVCISSVTFAAKTQFSDMPYGHWAYDAVVFLESKGIITDGYGNGTYLGNRNITRYEFAVMVARMHAKKVGTIYKAAIPFSDVQASHWAAKSVSFLADEGIEEGYEDGTFLGNRNLNRYEMAQTLANLIKNDAKNVQFKKVNKGIFKDVPSNSKYYEAVNLLATAEIIEGYGDGTYLGNKNITRYEMAQMLAKLYTQFF